MDFRPFALTSALLLAAACPALAQGTFGSISLPDRPNGVAVNTVTNTIYAVEANNPSFPGFLTAVDGATNVKRTIPLGGLDSVALAVNSVANEVYVANAGSGTVSLIDGATLSARTVTVGTNPQALVADVQNHRVYVADKGSNDVKVIDVATGTVTATLQTGTSPVALALNPVTDRIYIANQGDESVSVIDGASATITGKIILTNAPTAVKINSVTDALYVALSNGQVVTLDGTSYGKLAFTSFSPPLNIEVNEDANVLYVATANEVATVTGTVAPIVTHFPAVNGPASIAVDSRTNFAYILPQNADYLSVLDGVTNGLTQTSYPNLLYYPIEYSPNVPLTSLAALNPVTGRLYLGGITGGLGTIAVIDLAQYATQAVVPGVPNSESFFPLAVFDSANGFVYASNSPNPGKPGYVDIVSTSGTPQFAGRVSVGDYPLTPVANPVTGLVYVPNQLGRSLSVLNGAAVQATVSLGHVEPKMLAINPVTNTIYAAVFDGQIAVVNGSNNSVQFVTVGREPNNLAVNTATDTVWVANFEDGTVSAVDGATLKVSAPIAVGSQPQGIAVDPNRNLVYVTNSNSGTVSVIDGASHAVVATILVGSGPNLVTVDPGHNLIYVFNANAATISIIDGASRTVLSTAAVSSDVVGLSLDVLRNKLYTQNQTNPGAVVNPGGFVETVAGGNSFALPDPVTDRVYAGGSGGPNALDILTTERTGADPLTDTISPVIDGQTVGTTPLFQTRNATPSFQIAAVSNFPGPGHFTPAVQPTPTAIYYSVDGAAWMQQPLSSTSAGAATITLTPATVGEHVLSTFAAYGNNGSSLVNPSAQSPILGEVTSLLFLVDPPQAAVVSSLSVASTSIAFGTASTTLTATLTYSGTKAPTGALSFSVDGGTSVTATCTATMSPQTCSVSYATGILASGTYTITVTEAADANYAATSATGTLTVQPSSGTVVISAATAITALGNGSRGLTVTLHNTGIGSAQFVTLTGLTVGGVGCTPMPQMLGTLDPGLLVRATCTVPATAGTSGTTAVEKVLGTYEGGSFSGTYRIKLP